MTPERRRERLGRVRAALAEQDLDGFVVSHLPNVRYLTGFSGSAALLLVTPDEAVAFSDFRYREQAEAEAGAVARVEIVQRDLWGNLLDAAREIRRLGVEAHVLTVRDWRRVTADRSKGEVVPVEDVVEPLRAAKAPEEVEAIRRAAALALDALDATLPRVRAGLRELDVAAMLESELRMRGSEWHPFHTIVASGPRTALPHAGTTERVIEAGNLLLCDFGAQVDGYCADITRTFVVGRRADERQRTVHELVREAQVRAREHIRAGMTGREADALARSVIEARGFGEAFGHSLGHGLGLEVHEAPSVGPTADAVIPVDAVVTVEPGAYFPGWGGVRIEDDVHLTAEAAAMLSEERPSTFELV